MKCPRCQHENRDLATSCVSCGFQLMLSCPSCSGKNRFSARYCSDCGIALAKSSAAEATPDVAHALNTPKHLVDRILTSEVALVGERKYITPLFADVKGSLELIANRDPEYARRILDPALQIMMDAVHAYEGVVTEITGDGIAALFGAPIAYEDHALRAAYAAVRIQKEIKRFAARLHAELGVDLSSRVGMHSGEVVVRSLHKNLYMEYSAIGDTVHLAARMEQIAAPGEAYLTDATRRQLEGFLDVHFVDVVSIKGLPHAIPIFRLGEVRQISNRFQAIALAGTLRPLIGREREVEAIRHCSQAAFRGRGQVVSLVGEPGVGKSRLAFELERVLVGQGWATMQAQAVSYGARSAYVPLAGLLKAFLGVMANDEPSEISRRATEKLGALGLLDVLPAVSWLLDVPVTDAAWNDLDGAMRRQKTIEDLTELFVRVSQGQPLLLVFEDLHWIDAETQFVLDALAELVPAQRILLIMTCRPEYASRRNTESNHVELRIEPLPSPSADGLVQSLLGDDPSLRSLADGILQRADGNPLFIEESVRALVDAGALVGQTGTYRLGPNAADAAIPGSIQAILAARIDRLFPDDKEALQAASVIAKDFSLAVLHKVLGGELDAMRQKLRRLQAAEFVYETRNEPAEYTFKHALTHEVAYAGLLKDRRRHLHKVIVEAIEGLYPERLMEHTEILARHAVQGESWEKAVKYLRQAGLSAAGRSDFHNAETWYRSALDALGHLAADRKRIELAIAIRFELYMALVAMGDHAPIFEVLHEAERLGRQIDDKRQLARAYGYLSMARWWVADYAGAIEVARQAVALSADLRHPGLKSVGLVALGWTYTTLGQYDAAIEILNQVLALAREAPDRFRVSKGAPLVTVLAHSWLTSCYWEKGEFDQGRRHADEAVRLADGVDHPWSRVAAYYTLGTLLSRQGRPLEAVPILERGLALCEDKIIDSWMTSLQWMLGNAYALAGEPERAIPLLERAVRKSADDRKVCSQSLRVGWLAEAELIAGNLARAEALTREALAMAERYNERGIQGHLHRILGDIAVALNTGDRSTALPHYRRALAIASELAMRPLEARCHYAIAQVLATREDKQAGTDSLEAAMGLFAAMGIDPIIPTEVASTGRS